MLTVTARTRCIGFHHWPAAPARRSYLRDRHRHEFHITARVSVAHSERAVEFHDLQADIARDIYTLAEECTDDAYDFGASSCETLATGLADRLTGHGYAVLEVTWSEDGENDATWTPDPIEGPSDLHIEPATAEVPRQVDTEQAIPLASYTGGLPAVTARQDSGR